MQPVWNAGAVCKINGHEPRRWASFDPVMAGRTARSRRGASAGCILANAPTGARLICKTLYGLTREERDIPGARRHRRHVVTLLALCGAWKAKRAQTSYIIT